MVELLSFAAAMLIATAVLPLVRKYAAQLKLMDSPALERKVHDESIPRSGGLAILCGTACAIALWLPVESVYLPFLGCIAIVAIFGLLDDLVELNHIWKSLPQIIAAILVVWYYGSIADIPFISLGQTPVWLAVSFSLFFIVGVTNAVNLSDGLDGLAAGNCLLSIAALAVLSWQVGDQGYLVIALSLAGGIVGFLRFNTHPASIFMGDLGSQVIGFTAASLTVIIIASGTLPVSPMVPVLLFGLPILDTIMVMGVRAYKGNSLFKADRNHLHHQLLDLGFRHYEVVTILYVLQGIIVLLAYLLRFEADIVLLSVFLAYALSILSLLYIAHQKRLQVHTKPTDGSVDRRNRWLRSLKWYYLHTAKVISVLIALLLVFAGYVADPLPEFVSPYGLAASVFLIGMWIVFHKYPELVSRILGYSAIAGAIYALLLNSTDLGLTPLVDIYCACLLFALMLAIRVTRKNVFRLDTQDYLVGLFLVACPFVLQNFAEGTLIVRLVLYLAILFYACEYVITKGNKTRWLINIAAISSVSMMALGQ